TLARSFHIEVQRREDEWRQLLQHLAGSHTVAVWGAGAKGTTFVNLLDPDRKLVRCLVDLNPAKQGAFVAGSGHPIIGPDHLEDAGITCALLLNPNYEGEVKTLLDASNRAIQLVGV